MPYETFVRLFAELRDMGTSELIFSGDGEPFLHPRLFDIVSLAKKTGFRVTLFSNGTLLDESNIKSLMDSGLDILRVSLWAGTREEYVMNYPGTRPDLFERVVEGLSRLVAIKSRERERFPSILLHHPINRNNFHSIDALVDLALRIGCDGVSFSPLKSHRGKLAESRLSSNEEQEVRLSLMGVKKRLHSSSLNHNIDQTLFRYKLGEAAWRKVPCYIPWLHARIKVDGTVLVCNPATGWPMGNLSDQTFGEIWNGPAYRLFRRKALSRDGASFIDEHADCGFCCHIGDNLRVHRINRWLLPFYRPKEI
jgi:MoaA/NifB/PqqE/SkfB family radical SAM enzyme